MLVLLLYGWLQAQGTADLAGQGQCRSFCLCHCVSWSEPVGGTELISLGRSKHALASFQSQEKLPCLLLRSFSLLSCYSSIALHHTRKPWMPPVTPVSNADTSSDATKSPVTICRDSQKGKNFFLQEDIGWQNNYFITFYFNYFLLIFKNWNTLEI